MDQALEVGCPTCGEPTTVWVDVIDGSAELASDCEVCCRPLAVWVDVRQGAIMAVRVRNGW